MSAEIKVRIKAKNCTRCGERKPVGEFHRYPRGDVSSRCKVCVGEDARKSQGFSTLAQRAKWAAIAAEAAASE